VKTDLVKSAIPVTDPLLKGKHKDTTACFRGGPMQVIHSAEVADVVQDTRHDLPIEWYGVPRTGHEKSLCPLKGTQLR
jgi:hypothetical protein